LATSSNNHNDDSHGKKGINFVNNSDITHVNTQCKFVESTTVGRKKHQSEQNFGRRCSLAASSKKQNDDVNDSVTNSNSNLCIKPPSSVTPLNTNNQMNDSVQSKTSVSFHSTTTIIQPSTTNTATTDIYRVLTADRPSSTKSLCTSTEQLNEDKSSNSVCIEKNLSSNSMPSNGQRKHDSKEINCKTTKSPTKILSHLTEKRKDTKNHAATLRPLSMNTQSHQYVPANGALVGFTNNGSTCFLNTALQCLRSIDCFNQETLETHYSRHSGHLHQEYKNLISSILGYRTKQVINPFQFLPKTLSCIHSTDFSNGQHDLMEFLLCLLHQFECDPFYNSLPYGYSNIVSSTFEGKLGCRYACANCHHNQTSFDSFKIFLVDMDPDNENGAQDLEDCFAYTNRRETIEPGDVHCGNCRLKTKFYREQFILQLPPVLILCLKRFSRTNQKGKYIRNDAMVHFRLNLDVKKLFPSLYSQKKIID
jgi:ubiquitin C-terminal hydrolase